MKKFYFLIVISLLVSSLYSQNLLFSEDFEDNSLESEITIETTGTFSSPPGIQDITGFGSTKAFGFGKSTCTASCFDNNRTEMFIEFPDSVFIDSLVFTQMELDGDWGSQRKVIIDGEVIFSQGSQNDHVADTVPEKLSFTIGKNVKQIDIMVTDITTESEMFIDDINVYGHSISTTTSALTPVDQADFIFFTAVGNNQFESEASNGNSFTKLLTEVKGLGYSPAGVELNNEKITSAMLSGKTTLMFIGEYNMNRDFTTDEVTAISDYVDAGGNIFFTGNAHFNDLTELFGLTMTGNTGGSSGLDWPIHNVDASYFTDHDVTTGVSTITGDCGNNIEASSPAEIIGWSSNGGTPLLAISGKGSGKAVLWYGGGSFLDNVIPTNAYTADIDEGDNKTFLNNALNWLKDGTFEICNNLTLTTNTYSETDDLIASIEGEYGSNYTIADWNDLDTISDLGSWASCMGLQDGTAFMVTYNGKYMYDNNRQYFVEYSTIGVPSSFLVHAQKGNFYLGSWYGLNYKILAKKTCSGEFEFVSDAQPFIQSNVFTNSKSYFYYYINENEQTPASGTQFNFDLTSGNDTIPAGGKYFGNGIMQFWVEIGDDFNTSNLQILLPSKISNNGTEIDFKNVPSGFNTIVQKDPINQSIDIFAGGSAGVKLIAGGAGAGPSVAAASLSLNGTGGMGINFHRNSEGNEFITRRFEAGVGVSVEAPAINAVVGDIQAGISANVMVKGVMGQTMYFPNNLSTKLAQKAKAAYILETFTMGGIELSPFASIFLKALKNSLVSANPDLNAIYSDLYYSNQTGNSIEGEASIGFSVASGEGSEQTKLDIVEFGGYVALTKQTFENVQNNDKSFRFGYASGFDVSALNFKVANVDFGNVFDFKYGIDFSIGANYNPTDGIKSFELSYGATPSAQISLASFSSSYNYDFIIPKSIITKNQNSDNLIGSVAPIFIPGLPKRRFKVGMNYFTENLAKFYADNPDKLESFNDHIIMQKTESSSKGLDVDAKIGLDAALGVGAGLKLGIHFSYLDEMYYPKSDYIVAHNQILPIAQYNDIPDEQRLFSIQDEIQDVFQGTVLLVKEQLNNLVNVIDKGIESGKQFTVNMLNGAAKLTGQLVGNGLKWITRTSNPTTKSVQKSAFLEPKVINAYSSRRIIHLQNKSASLANEEGESIMYIVSDNVNVSLVNSDNEVINEFEPVTLSIAIDNDKMNELGLGENEKLLAKMYKYDAENLVWIELAGDSNSHLDTISTQITNSASYAIGIELNSKSDTTAPDIQDYYPKNEDNVEPVTNFWAKLYESPIGVGIDLSQTIIKIDDMEVDAVWNPVENIISFESVDSLSIGQHTFEVIVKDYNGNTNSVKSTFTVGNSTGINSIEKIVQFNCYPVPMRDILNIEIDSKSSTPISVSIYNQIGQLVSSTFKCQPINGSIKIQWDRTGNNYQRVKSGTYFVRIKQEDNIMVKKIVLE